MRIKNLNKVKKILKGKLSEYLEELDCEIHGTKVSCPNIEAHTNNDKGKLSAGFLPQSNQESIYCFVEERKFDIFDIYALRNDMSLNGQGFYNVVKELANKFNVSIEEEYEYSMKEKEINRQRRFLQKLHSISIKGANRGLKYYKKRRVTKEKAKYFQIGWIEPDDIEKSLDKECKKLFDYHLSKVLIKGGLVIPVFTENHQYNGLVIRMFNTRRNDEYLKICLKGSNLFNINNVKGREKLTVVEGVFDAISLHPKTNVVATLTNAISDANLEKVSELQMKEIDLALDPDNLYQGKARDGILRSILKMKNLDSTINLVKFPETKEEEVKQDPDEYMKDHSIEDFEKLERMSAIDYLIENQKKQYIKPRSLYEFIAGCPDIIKKEKYITQSAKELEIGKKDLTKKIDSISKKKDSFNMIQYVQEQDSYDEVLEDFTDQAWNKNYEGIPSGFPMFDQKFGGFEDTLYLLIGYPEQGKTSCLLNFVYNLAHNKNTFVGFYSLDDGVKRAIIPRLMSIASGIPTKHIRQPEKKFKKQWFQGLNKLKELKKNLTLKDGSDIQTIKDLNNYVKIHSTMAEEQNKKFVMVIDNLHDLSSGYNSDSLESSQRVSSYLKRLPQNIGCPIISTAEVRKSAKGEPTGKDIKESVDLWYAARFVASIYSDFHQSKNTHLVWVDEKRLHQPIMKLKVCKNQTGSAEQDSLYYKFSRTNNKLVEANEKEHKLLKDGQHLSFAD